MLVFWGVDNHVMAYIVIHAAQREQELLAQKQAAQEKEEPPQNSDFRQLIGDILSKKSLHNDVEDLIESALNSKLLSINLKSQRLDKEKQEVKNIVEHVPKRRTRLTKCLKNFKVIHNESIIPLNKTPQISLVIANTPDLPTKEPEYSLSMGDEHLSTILETEPNEVIKSSVKNLVPIPSEFEVTSDNERRSDGKFQNLFEPSFDNEEIMSTKIEEADFDLEEEICFFENLSYDNSSPRPPKELNAKTADMILKSLSPYPIRVEDSDFDIEEIDLFLAMDDLMPPGIEYDDYDSEGDILFLEELLSDDPTPFPKNESFNFDHHDDPSFPRPPPKPLDVEVFFDFEPDTGVLTAKVMEDIFEHYVLMPKVLPSQTTLCLNIDTLLPFSSENKDQVFKPGILSYLLVSHQDTITSDFFENPMMMYGGDIPFLDIPCLHFYPL
nr:hypothetical protein [Tanacetum cinerariifolium]